jgi:hypothetical protein
MAQGRAAIVKINDVGPLVRGRIIDLNETSMRYFSGGAQGANSGLLGDIKVWPLRPGPYRTGPVDSQVAMSMLQQRGLAGNLAGPPASGYASVHSATRRYHRHHRMA